MRTLIGLLACLLGTMLATAPFAEAQNDVDIVTIAESISGIEPNALVATLDNPMTNDMLPSGLSDATFVDPRDATVAVTSGTIAEGDQPAGIVTYFLTYAPGGSATPSAQATPQAGGPERIYNAAAVYYLVFDHELDAQSLEHFDTTLRAVVGSQAADVDVQEIIVQNSAAYLISIEIETNGIPLVMEWIAVPVGPVAVISMTMAGGESVNVADVQSDAEALVLASIGHLGSAAEHSSTPAG